MGRHPHGDTALSVLPSVPVSVVHMLRDAASRHPDAPALTFGARSLNYREYASAVASLACHWSSWVQPQDRIALILPNSMDLAIAIYAAHALRCQVVALNPRYTEREMALMLRDAQPALVVHDAGVAADLAGASGLSPERIQPVKAGDSFSAQACRSRPLDDPLPTHDDLATLQYTSGTSGRPKGVDISHRQLAFNLAQREALLPTRKGQEKVLCVMPLFHVSAVAMSLHLACYAASELVIHPRFDAAQTLRTISQQRITVLSAVPTIFRSLLSEPTLAGTDFTSLAHCYSGAAPLPANLLARWEAMTGCPILEGYGLSEAGPCLTYNPQKGLRKPGSVGLPVPCSELEIVDPDDGDTRQPCGTEGEIRVRGPHVMAGYRSQPAMTRQALRDGWLYTGDIGVQDQDGYIYVKGRKHDAINVGGYMVHPREVEEVLLMHPAIAQAGVFAVPDEYYGQVVQAWIVARSGMRIDIDEILAHCRANLVRYKVPHALGVATALPLNPTGKLLRHQLMPVPKTVSHSQ